MSDKIFNIITDKISETYPNACVLWIDQVQNENLQKRYQQTKFLLEVDPNISEIIEKHLFHGTSVECISSICGEGFKQDMNKVSAYGKGTYFSDKAALSWGYMKSSQKHGDAEISYMFYANILFPTYNSSKNPVKSVNNDQIVVVSDDNLIYPTYIIAFHKNAVK